MQEVSLNVPVVAQPSQSLAPPSSVSTPVLTPLTSAPVLNPTVSQPIFAFNDDQLQDMQ